MTEKGMAGMATTGAVLKELVDLTLAWSHGNEACRTPIPFLQIVRSDRPTLPMPTVYNPTLCVVVQGEKLAAIGGNAFRFRAGQFLVASVNVPVTGQVTRASSRAPFLCLVLELDLALIYDLLREMGPMEPGRDTTRQGVFLEGLDPGMQDALLRLMRCLGQVDDQRVLAPLVLREVTYLLLRSPHGHSVRQAGMAGSQLQRIARVIDRIRRQFDKPLSMEELARDANMSPSTFFHHFKLATTMSPLRYQKELRLQEAWRLLSAEVADAASAAFRVGYESASQFNREYARMFGLPPMADIKRLRLGRG
jgi:AraC-like DNA-binding protein